MRSFHFDKERVVGKDSLLRLRVQMQVDAVAPTQLERAPGLNGRIWGELPAFLAPYPASSLEDGGIFLRSATPSAPRPEVDLDPRAKTSAHRLLLEVARLGGGPVLASTISESGALAPATLTKLFRPDTDIGEYLTQFLIVKQKGHTKILTLTEAGRILVEKMRFAGPTSHQH